MPFEQPEIPPKTKCVNCGHLYSTHDRVDCCEVCSCFEFLAPPMFRPQWISEKDSLYAWICRSCFPKLFPEKRRPPLDSDEEVKCHLCGEFVKCSRISNYFIEINTAEEMTK